MTIFTSGQIMVMFIVTIIFVYAFLSKILDVINRVATARVISKVIEKGATFPNDHPLVKEFLSINKEEKEDENK